MKMEVLVKRCEKVKNGYFIEIEPSEVLYTDGKGGQLGDRGKIGGSKIVEVKEDGVVVDRELECMEYEVEIDYVRQEDIACQHTAQHMFSAIAYKEYGLNTVGFRMAEEYTTVDLDSNQITVEMVDELERMANEIIKEAIQLNIFVMGNEEARKIEGLRKEIKEKVVGDVRFVEIPGIDLGACAGFHVENTKDIQLFKIVNYEKIKGNYTRFYFLAGKRALRDYSFKHSLSKELGHIFSCKDYEIIEMVNKSLEERKKIESEYKNLASKYVEFLADELLRESEVVGEYQPIFYFGDSTVAQFLGKFMGEKNILITGNEGNFSVTAQKLNCKEFIKYLLEKKSTLKGGGNQVKGNFKGEIGKEELREILMEYIKLI